MLIEEGIVSITNETPDERFADLAESYEARLSRHETPTRGSGRLTLEPKLKEPTVAPSKHKARKTGQLSDQITPPAAKNRWAGPLTITSSQAIADTGSVWIKGQTKAGESVHIRFDGDANSLSGGTVTINGEPMQAAEKDELLNAVTHAVVPYGGELVSKRIKQHLAVFAERIAGYTPQA